MLWERPLRGSDEVSTVLVLVDGVLSVQQTLGRSNVNVDVDPVFRGAVVEFADAIGHKPLVNKIESFL